MNKHPIEVKIRYHEQAYRCALRRVVNSTSLQQALSRIRSCLGHIQQVKRWKAKLKRLEEIIETN